MLKFSHIYKTNSSTIHGIRKKQYVNNQYCSQNVQGGGDSQTPHNKKKIETLCTVGSDKEYHKNTKIKVTLVFGNTLNKNLNSLERDSMFLKMQEMNYGNKNDIDSHNNVIEVLHQYRGHTQQCSSISTGSDTTT